VLPEPSPAVAILKCTPEVLKLKKEQGNHDFRNHQTKLESTLQLKCATRGHEWPLMQGPFSVSGHTRAVSARVKLTFHIVAHKVEPSFRQATPTTEGNCENEQKSALHISPHIPRPPSVRSLLSKILEQPLPTLHTRPRTPSHNVSSVPCAPSSPSVYPLSDSVSVDHAVLVSIFHRPV
jgi:hypothetical protein